MSMTKPKRKTKRGAKAPDPANPAITQELLDQLLAAGHSREHLLGESGLLRQLTSALINRALEAGASEHLGYERGQEPPAAQSNRRNGVSKKKVRSDLEIAVLRDREGTFEPELVAKHQRQFDPSRQP